MKKFRARLGVFTFLWSLTGPGAGAAPSPSTTAGREHLDLAQSKGEVTFLAVGYPSAIQIQGKTQVKPAERQSVLKGDLSIQGKNITGDTSFALDSLDTGMDLRNRHMKEKYLETAKFPNAKLNLKKAELPEPFTGAKLEKKNIPFVGTLTLHGVTKDVAGTFDFAGEGKTAQMAFNFKLAISDFGIAPPSFLKISVANDVTIGVNLQGALVRE